MEIEEIGIDDYSALAEWLANEEVAEFQRTIEEKIAHFLFNADPDDPKFAETVQLFAWLGSSEADRASIEQEIVALNRISELELCGFWKSASKIGKFIAKHKFEILVGAALCATGVGLAMATGYTCTAVIGGVAVVGAGSIFDKQEQPKTLPPAPASKAEIALAQQPITPPLPKLVLPTSANELLVTASGVWVNQQFYSTQALQEHSLFAEELNKFITLHQPPPAPELPSTPIPHQTIPTPQNTHPTQTAQQIPTPPIPEPQPKRSQSFLIPGEQRQNCQIGWINGINNTLEESKQSASYIQSLSGGQAVSGIYNCTHGSVVDLLEAAFLNHQGYSPKTAELLQAEWKKFHEANADRPSARFLQICHSQGAIDVKNALTGSPEAIRNRIIVVAVAPGAIVPTRLCFKSYNYASEKDIVYKLEPPPKRPVTSLTIDGVILPTYGEALDDRRELIILKPHPEAEGIDHSFQSPTYQSPIFDIIQDYKKHQGQYLPTENGNQNEPQKTSNPNTDNGNKWVRGSRFNRKTRRN